MFFATHRKSIRIIISTNAFIQLATAMLGPIYALFVEEIGGSLLEASYAAAIFAIAAGITSLASGRITDRIKEKEYIVIIGYTVIGLGFLLMLLVKNIYSLLIIQALVGFGEAFYAPAFDAIFTQHANRRKKGRQWAAWESMYYFTTAIGAIIGGLLVTWFGFQIMFVVMGIMCLATTLYIFVLPRKAL